MNCRALNESVLDLARGVAPPESVRTAVQQHLRECAACAADFDRQRGLTVDLQTLAAHAQAWHASPEIEERLRAALGSRPLAGSPVLVTERGVAGGWRYPLVAAAIVVLAVWAGRQAWRSDRPAPRRPPAATVAASPAQPSPESGRQLASARPSEQPSTQRPRSSGRRRPRPASPVQVRSFEFVTLPGAAGLPDLESGSVVRIEVPVAALPGYGVEIVPNTANTTVQADLLVGQDGQPRAIRLVSSEEQSQDTRSRR